MKRRKIYYIKGQISVTSYTTKKTKKIEGIFEMICIFVDKKLANKKTVIKGLNRDYNLKVNSRDTIVINPQEIKVLGMTQYKI